MNFKELFHRFVDIIDINRKRIIVVSLSILGIIILSIVFFASSSEFSVQKEASTLLTNIENRRYNLAIGNYETYEKTFSESKMKRLNKSISKKISSLLIESGDNYINNKITKEQYIGMINTLNALNNIEIDFQRIIEQAKRVDQMYVEENVNYDLALGYMNIVSTLNGIGNELDIYKSNIKEINQSREMYKKAEENRENQLYYEAILEYDKVLQKDEKYYDLAMDKKDECIENMYDYYIEQARISDENGNYEKALKYIEYTKKYYIDDEQVLQLEKKYKEKLSLYTLSAEDIINLISKKSDKDKDNLTINSFYQMINEKKYYYVEVLEYDTLIDELLIDAKTKDIYSYKDINKDYNNTYSDGFFRCDEKGNIEFAISEGKAQFLLKNKLNKNHEKYKEIYTLPEDKLYKYIENEEHINKLLDNKQNLYYYEVVNKGFFKPKEVYIINMYNEKIYKLSDEGIKEY